eukprot:6141133-Pyramimonas_sp.AAC.1
MPSRSDACLVSDGYEAARARHGHVTPERTGGRIELSSDKMAQQGRNGPFCYSVSVSIPRGGVIPPNRPVAHATSSN